MAPKRKRHNPSENQGLQAGERLKRNAKAGHEYHAWSWVGTEVTEAADITQEHVMAACSLSPQRGTRFCPNKYARPLKRDNSLEDNDNKDSPSAQGVEVDDVVVVCDEEQSECVTKQKNCRHNPFCLNYLGQEKWENEATARKLYMKNCRLGEDPRLQCRSGSLPVGLRIESWGYVLRQCIPPGESFRGQSRYCELMSFKVWFQDPAFRRAVFLSRPTCSKVNLEGSPLFQLQVTFAALQESKLAVFDPVKLVKVLGLDEEEQQDSQEFAKLFLTHLEQEFNQQQGIPIIRSLIADQVLPNIQHAFTKAPETFQFQGNQIDSITCEACQHRSEQGSAFLELPIVLEVGFPDSKLEDRIAILLASEVMTDDNRYACPQCGIPQKAVRRSELSKLPPVLHFSIMRFVYDAETGRKKSKHRISFPMTLDMSPFITAGANSDSNPPEGDAQDLYELRGVLLHRGTSVHRGHYVAQVYQYSDRSWYEFNDEVVSRLDTASLDQGSGQESLACADDRIDVEQEAHAPKRGKQRGKKPKKNTAKDDGSEDAYMLVYARRSMEPLGSTDEREHGNVDLSSVGSPPEDALSIVRLANEKHRVACAEFIAREIEAARRFSDLRRQVMEIYARWQVLDANQRYVITSQNALKQWLLGPLGMPSSSVASAAKNGLTDVSIGTDPVSVHELIIELLQPDQKLDPISVTELICPHNQVEPKKSVLFKCITEGAYDSILSMDGGFKPRLVPKDICRQCVIAEFDERMYSIDHREAVTRLHAAPSMVNDQGYWISKSWLRDSRSTDRRATRRQAEEEKNKLCHTYNHALNGDAALLEDVPLAIVPASFVRQWRQWLGRPDRPRPWSLDNSSFLCKHGLLAIDPNNPRDLDPSKVSVIKRSDWDMFHDLYGATPLIEIENQQVGDAYRVVHKIPVCERCIESRRLNWVQIEMTIRLASSHGVQKNLAPTQSAPILQTAGPRKSKRLRDRDGGVRTTQVKVTKDTTVKHLRMSIQDQLGIPTIAQRLYLRGQELKDNTKTAAELEISTDDVLELQEISEDFDALDSDIEHEFSSNKRSRTEGFVGTKLVGRSSPDAPKEKSSAREMGNVPTASEIQPASTDEDLHECPICEKLMAVYISPGDLVCLECNHSKA
ncbi:cysteine proteinase [Punctularia strigosozonata HHB-11173 SS5]|uniref:cysteine proteinase n=1 Tax=Punctularia strigosozonata (strain HHB-11173) TaxID=741275 RepID=UPI00044184AA|nr:cysteine proteinase [Punctularia strigosozonata HHB-11173 SS5]EIN07261.1 cysteine proteinase [Punctularia strigosozonata HHB-11173 SS5]